MSVSTNIDSNVALVTETKWILPFVSDLLLYLSSIFSFDKVVAFFHNIKSHVLCSILDGTIAKHTSSYLGQVLVSLFVNFVLDNSNLWISLKTWDNCENNELKLLLFAINAIFSHSILLSDVLNKFSCSIHIGFCFHLNANPIKHTC